MIESDVTLSPITHRMSITGTIIRNRNGTKNIPTSYRKLNRNTTIPVVFESM